MLEAVARLDTRLSLRHRITDQAMNRAIGCRDSDDIAQDALCFEIRCREVSMNIL